MAYGAAFPDGIDKALPCLECHQEYVGFLPFSTLPILIPKTKPGPKSRTVKCKPGSTTATQSSPPAESGRGQYVGVERGRLRVSSGGGEGDVPCVSLLSKPLAHAPFFH